jgi:signal transduction histidine kinase
MHWSIILVCAVVLLMALRHYSNLHRSCSHAHDQLQHNRHRLEQAEKLASLGAMSAGIAHEMSTPVGAVRCMTSSQQMARDKLVAMVQEKSPELAADPKFSKCLNVFADGDRVVGIGMEQISSLLVQLRHYASKEAPHPVVIDLHERLEGALLLIRNMTKNSIEVRREFGELPEIKAYPVQFMQIMLNLMTNAVRAMPDGGVLTLTTSLVDGMVQVQVADTGVGIPVDDLERIFEFGYTTHGDSGGSGLGLPITYEMVLQHCGSLTVESEPGQGTTFCLRLPLNLADRLEGDCNFWRAAPWKKD